MAWSLLQPGQHPIPLSCCLLHSLAKCLRVLRNVCECWRVLQTLKGLASVANVEGFAECRNAMCHVRPTQHLAWPAGKAGMWVQKHECVKCAARTLVRQVCRVYAPRYRYMEVCRYRFMRYVDIGSWRYVDIGSTSVCRYRFVEVCGVVYMDHDIGSTSVCRG